MLVAACDQQISLASQFVIGILFDEAAQSRDPQIEVDARRRLWQLKSQRQVVGSFRDERRGGVLMRGEQVLPSPPRLVVLALLKLALSQTKPRLDVQFVVRVLLDKLGETFDGFVPILQVLEALPDEQFGFGPCLRIGSHLDRFFKKREGLLIVGGFRFVVGLEIAMGELQVDVGDLLFAVGRKQILGFRAIDHLGIAKPIQPRVSRGLGKAHSPRPRALGKVAGELIEDLYRFVVSLLVVVGSALEEGQIVSRSFFVLQRFVDLANRVLVVAVLHRLADVGGELGSGGVQLGTGIDRPIQARESEDGTLPDLRPN